MRRALRGLLVALAVPTVVFAVSEPVAADTLDTGLAAAAWYAPLPTCGLATGCAVDGLPSDDQYLEGTVHVGITAGVEAARTYLKLDTSSMPAGSIIRTAILVLPVASSGDGSSNASHAELLACSAPAGFAPSSGSRSTPPPVDCGVSAPAKYASEPVPQFTINLQRFVDAWGAGAPDNGIVLMPAAAATEAHATWHVSFWTTDAQGASARPVSASISYDAAIAPASSADSAPGPASPWFSIGGGGMNVGPVLSFPNAEGAVDGSGAGALLPERPRPAQPALSLPLTDDRFQYPIALFFPLLVIVLGGYLGWALTRSALSCNVQDEQLESAPPGHRRLLQQRRLA